MTKANGQMLSRDRFLERVAKHLGRERLYEKPVRPEWPDRPQWSIFQNHSTDQLVEELKQQCKLIHTDVIETTKQELGATIKDVIARNEAKTVIAWDDPRFAQFGLDDVLAQVSASTWKTENREESIKVAEQADVGITFSDITLAESATVVLFANEGKGRSVSLLPTTYIAIIPKSTIVPRLTQAAAEIDRRLADGETIASCINFISGPSNSADIEMNLIVGVHGPVKATYLIVDDS